MSRRVLLLGKNGQLGYALRRLLTDTKDLTALGSADVDLAEPDRIRDAVRDVRPALIINAAAYTAVDRAEDEPDRAMAINARAPAVLAEEADRLGAALVHYSTDYVFDGGKGAPYTESDLPQPLSVYGRSKLSGDQAVLASGAACLIFRTSWLYGRRGQNFLLTMQRLLREREEVRVVGDQIGSPTWCDLVAVATVRILDKGGDDLEAFIRRHSGLYNMSCGGQTSWFGFASAIRGLMSENGVGLGQLREIPSLEYPTRAMRPGYSVLDNNRLKKAFGLGLPDWRRALKAAMGTGEPDVADGMLTVDGARTAHGVVP